jgi:hypothetical protein
VHVADSRLSVAAIFVLAFVVTLVQYVWLTRQLCGLITGAGDDARTLHADHDRTHASALRTRTSVRRQIILSARRSSAG